MAGSATRPGRLIAALTALVLALHLALLAWLASAWATPSVLRPLATPMFTRQITPASPVAIQKVPPALMRAHKGALQNVAKSTPDSGTTSVADLPAPVASAPTAAAITASSEPVLASQPTASAASAPASASTRPATIASPLDSWPADTRLSYRLTGNYRGPLTGEAQVQWQRQGSAYQARIALDIGFLVTLSLTSQGEVTPQGLMPRAYEELLRARRRAVTFGSQTITLANGQQRERPNGVQDTASQFVALSHRFSTGEQALAVGEAVTFWMARPGGLDRWTYTVQAEETLYLPLLGPVQAFHLLPAPLPNPRGNIVAEMWFAPSLQYLPVRIRITLGDDNFVDLLVEKIEQQ